MRVDAMIFGDTSRFGIEFLGRSGGLEVANIYVAGRNITPIDNFHYGFAYNLTKESKRFENCREWLACCKTSLGNTIEEIFSYIYHDEIRFKCRIFDWGPPTDDCFFVLIPYENKLYIHGKLDGVDQSFGIEVEPSTMIEVFQETLKYITSQ